MTSADAAWVKEPYERNALRIYKLVFRRLGDAGEAENIAQDTFLALLKRDSLRCTGRR